MLHEYIYINEEENYYYSDDFSSSFYISLAKAGFISTTTYSSENEVLLLPEIQFTYAVLDFRNLHISKKVKKLLNKVNYEFSINKNFNEVLQNLNTYHEQSWLNQEYVNTLKDIKKNKQDNFELISIELKNNEEQLIAGELGYKIGKTYTSLTGFTSKEKQYNNWGKLQLVLLSKYLEDNSYDFWNLGHSCLQYKIDLGAKVLNREDFLKRWLESTKH